MDPSIYGSSLSESQSTEAILRILGGPSHFDLSSDDNSSTNVTDNLIRIVAGESLIGPFSAIFHRDDSTPSDSLSEDGQDLRVASNNLANLCRVLRTADDNESSEPSEQDDYYEDPLEPDHVPSQNEGDDDLSLEVVGDLGEHLVSLSNNELCGVDT